MGLQRPKSRSVSYNGKSNAQEIRKPEIQGICLHLHSLSRSRSLSMSKFGLVRQRLLPELCAVALAVCVVWPQVRERWTRH